MTDEHRSLSEVLDAVRRRAIIDNLDHLAALGWYLSHPATGALTDPADLARRLREGENDLLVAAGVRGTVVPSPAPYLEEDGSDACHDDQDEEVSGLRSSGALAPGTT